jgi:hypothetical protein
MMKKPVSAPAWIFRVLLLLVLLCYWAVSLQNLTVLPIVYEDEPWQASVGAKIAAHGILGSDLFEGYHEMERHYFGFMPLFPIALAALFRFADAGLLQARFVTVSGGLLVLALTFNFAKRLRLDARVGLLATALLLGVRVFAVSPLHPTGILFLDAVRVARYDVLVPVLGLAALHAYLSARRTQQLFWYGLAGCACALAALTHVYGAFFLLSILALMSWEKLSRRAAAIGATLGGFVLPCTLYALYGFAHLDTWRAQTRLYAERFDVLNPAWYVNNLLREPARYAIGLNDDSWWLRPGMWLVGIGFGASFVWLARRARRENNFAARVLVVITSIFIGGYALVLYSKFTNYLFAALPFVALALAWGLWNFFGACARSRPRFARVSAYLLGSVLFVESVLQVAQLHHTALNTTPYATLIAQVQAFIPRGARVIGMHHYGFGWEGYAYRSLAVPLLLVNPELETPPIALTDALDAQRPAFLLIDARMRAYLENDSRGSRKAFWDWMTARKAARIGSVDDKTYGAIEIYRVRE